MAKGVLPFKRTYVALSLKDLLEARDVYHVHLSRMENVRGTAIGKYLVRTSETDAKTPPKGVDKQSKPGSKKPRTLDNSIVTPWSWPCVLVFVDEWMSEDEVRAHPEELVPKTLFLSDGRAIPVCVVYAPASDDPLEPIDQLSVPGELFGGGYSCLVQSQGKTKAGTVACLVTDGDETYALTNRHVIGQQGKDIMTSSPGGATLLGKSAGIIVNEVPLSSAFPAFPGNRTMLTVDAGLIEIEDLNVWTTQVFGLGVLDDPLDLSDETMTLDLIGMPLKAYGGASGVIEGEVKALFYRHRTMGGIDHVTELLIGAKPGGDLRTRPGDSGTLWAFDPGTKGKKVDSVVPVGLQWGGHVFTDGGTRKSLQFALATLVSTVCKSLDVEIVRDWNIGHSQYWGEVGHYTIGARACELVSPKGLKDFFMANQSRVSFDVTAIANGHYHTKPGDPFHPLADVPDLVWKPGGSEGYRSHEKPNHFADMDQPGANGKTLLEMFREDPSSLDPAIWDAFYIGIKITPSHRGLLPFRVAQLYKFMVAELKKKTDIGVNRAFVAAGVMSHYVGDACQPLHVSQFHHGRTAAEADVHEDYETKMVNKHKKDIIKGLDDALPAMPGLVLFNGHREAARATALLMDRTFIDLDPIVICNSWVNTGGTSDGLWGDLGSKTIGRMADGCHTLATIWSSAWNEANATAPAASLIDADDLHDIYVDKTVAPSMFLPELVAANIW